MANQDILYILKMKNEMSQALQPASRDLASLGAASKTAAEAAVRASTAFTSMGANVSSLGRQTATWSTAVSNATRPLNLLGTTAGSTSGAIDVLGMDMMGAASNAAVLEASLEQVALAAREAANASKTMSMGTSFTMGGPTPVVPGGGVAPQSPIPPNVVPDVNKATKAFELNTQQLNNMAFQMNDMAVMLASGQSPFVMIMQQGMQIGQIFGSGVGPVTALKATGSALLSFLVNPINLSIVAFAAAAGAADKLISLVSSDGPGLKKVMEDYKEAIGELSGAYSEAGKAAQRFATESGNVLRYSVQTTVGELKSAVSNAADDIFSTVTSSTLSGAEMMVPDFAPFTSAIEGLKKSIASGTPDILEFRNAIIAIADSDQADRALQARARELLKMSKEAAAVQLNTEGAERALKNLGASGIVNSINNVTAALNRTGLAADVLTRLQTLPEFGENRLADADMERRVANALGNQQDAQIRADRAKAQKESIRDLRLEVDEQQRLAAIAGQTGIAYERQAAAIRVRAQAQKEGRIATQEEITLAQRAAELEFASSQASDNSDRLRGMTAEIEAQRQLLGLAGEVGRARAMDEAAIAAQSDARARGVQATQAEIAMARELAGLQFDTAEAERQAEATRNIDSEIEATRRLMGVKDEVGRTRAISEALIRAESDAMSEGRTMTEEMIARTRELAGAQYDLQNATQSAGAGIAQYMEEYTREANDYGKNAASIMGTTVSQLENATMAFFTGQKVQWKQMVSAIIQEVLRLYVIKGIISAAMNYLAPGSGPMTNAGGSMAATAMHGAWQGAAYGPNGRIRMNATGNAFGNQGVYTTPTFFRDKAGGMNVMGEKHDEAVMPLTKMSDGSLGVRGMGTGGSTQLSFSSTVNVDLGSMGGGGAVDPATAENMSKALENNVRTTVIDTVKQLMRPGGMLQQGMR